MTDEQWTLRFRVGLATTLCVAIFCSSAAQPLVDTTWDYLKTNALYRSSTFETLWTVLCYAAIEPYITFVFLRNPQWRFDLKDDSKACRIGPAGPSTGGSTQTHRMPGSEQAQGQDAESSKRVKPRGMRRPARRWREALVYAVPLLVLDLTMIKKFANVPLSAKLESGNYDISFLSTKAENISSTSFVPLDTSRSGHFLAPTLHNFTFSSPLQTTRALPELAPSSRRVALELLISIVLYDTLFFFFHLFMHVTPLLKRWHNPHHAHGAMHPQITNQLSVFERLGLVLLANFSLNIISAHVLTRTLFVPLFVWLLIEVHSGLDAPWGLERLLPHGWANGARKHASHHATGRGALQPFFGWWDGLLSKVGIDI